MTNENIRGLVATLSKYFGKTPNLSDPEDAQLKWQLMDFNVQAICRLLLEQVDRNEMLEADMADIRREIESLGHVPEEGEGWRNSE